MKHNVLTVRKIEAISQPGYICDGMGLWLQTSAYGTKSWVFRYTINGRPREMGLGSYRAISLRLARELAREQREHLLRGDDPIDFDATGVSGPQRHLRRESSLRTPSAPITICTGR